MASNFIGITRRYTARSRWEDVAKQIDAGNDGYLTVGDEIGCTLKNGTEVVIQVLALNPYKPDSVVFGIRDIHWEKAWNDRNTNAGGWRDCKMRQFFNNDLLNLLPDDLVAAITPRKIVQKINGTTYESLDKLWAYSYTEINGADRGTDRTGDVGDVQFDFFKEKRNRVKFKNGEPYYHATRSPNATSTTYFWFVSGYGSMSYYYGANYSYGVCPCFIISKRKVTQ